MSDSISAFKRGQYTASRYRKLLDFLNAEVSDVKLLKNFFTLLKGVSQFDGP